MVKPYLEGEPPELDGWFESMLTDLRNRWVRTRHNGECESGGWACEIFNKCTDCNEHVSIACSLAGEANLIGQLLGKEWGKKEHLLFLQTYLRTLCEFVRNLEDVADILNIKIKSPPKLVCFWGNNYAKHRLSLLAQHHPFLIIPESYGEKWQDFERTLNNARAIDRLGNRHEVFFIDRVWLSRPRSDQLQQANEERQAIIILPPMAQLLDKTIQYFRLFVDKCIECSDALKKFESEHFCIGCW